LFNPVAFHMQYAREVFPPARVHRHFLEVAAYAALCGFMLVLVLSGLADGGELVALHRWGVHSAAAHLPAWAFVLCLTYTTLSFAINAPLLLRPGLRQVERRIAAWPVLLIPLIAVYELSICFGKNPLLPLAGYIAALASVTGAFILAERFRTLIGSGSVVGSYRIVERLGSGGMADVYLARRSGGVGDVVQRVALKRLRAEHVDDPNFARMFLDEARIAARLVHPNIVTLLDVGEHRGELYLAMELVEGTALSRILQLARRRQKRIDEAAVIEVGVQLADALAYAHGRTDDDGRPLELVHRDVSPHNVLVARDGHVKLSDFGIARSLARDPRTATGFMKGKISYMAPEQVSSSSYDQRVDVYALGVVLFEMLSGRRPYDGSDEPSILRRLLDRDPEPYRRASTLPAPLGPLIRAATDPDSSRRIAAASELRAALLPLRDEGRARAQLSVLVADTLAAGAMSVPDAFGAT
jgi:tRNA A-37 threonylcarbamoyl transferase component Bud32